MRLKEIIIFLVILGCSLSRASSWCKNSYIMDQIARCTGDVGDADSQRCQNLRQSLVCVEELVKTCSNALFRAGNARSNIERRINSSGCAVEVPKPTPTPEPPPEVCSDLLHPELLGGSLMTAHIPDSFRPRPLPPSVSCGVSSKSTELEHCSLFSYSHLRSFKSNSLSTCFIPGSWYLMKYPGLVEIIVHNSVPRLSVAEDVTRIDNVTVVFSPNNCHGKNKMVYTASVDKFPDSFENDSTPSANQTIELETGEHHAIMRSHPYNITIAIRSTAGHLSIAVQAPEQFVVSDGGLCQSGCPNHARRVDVVRLKDDWCGQVTNNVLFACATDDVIFNGHHLTRSPSYHEVCIFDVLKQKDYAMVLLNSLAAQDALLLKAIDVLKEKKTESPFFPFQKFAVTNGNGYNGTVATAESGPMKSEINIQLNSKGVCAEHSMLFMLVCVLCISCFLHL